MEEPFQRQICAHCETERLDQMASFRRDETDETDSCVRLRLELTTVGATNPERIGWGLSANHGAG